MKVKKIIRSKRRKKRWEKKVRGGKVFTDGRERRKNKLRENEGKEN